MAVENIAEVLVQLKAAGIHLADRWYRSAVDVGTVGYRSQYQTGSCPNAEKLATMCLNLPTHPGCHARASQTHMSNTQINYELCDSASQWEAAMELFPESNFCNPGRGAIFRKKMGKTVTRLLFVSKIRRLAFGATDSRACSQRYPMQRLLVVPSWTGTIHRC